MKTLSIQQPWAWAILNVGKNIENRSWHTDFRGRILIHAGKKIDQDGIYCLVAHRGIRIPDTFDTGGIVGSVEIVDCVTTSTNPWFSGPYGFVLKDPIALPFVPYKGKLGFFECDYQLLRINP